MKTPDPRCARCNRLRGERDQLQRRLRQAEIERDEERRRTAHARAGRRAG